MSLSPDLIASVCKVVVVLGVVLGLWVPWLSLTERRFGAALQKRYGPHRAGPGGLLQPLADGLKLLAKRDERPANADGVAYALAPLIALVPTLAIFAAIPFGETLTVGGQTFALQVADLELIYVLAMGGIASTAGLLAGWSTGDRFAAVGGLRFIAQQAGFGLCLGLALVGVCLLDGSLHLGEIVLAQTGALGPLPRWNMWFQPLGFLVFLVCILAWSGRRPFDTGIAPEELAAGYRAGYGGVRFALLAVADQARLIAGAALAVTLYGGGWHLPLATIPGAGPPWMDLLKIAIFGIKVGLLLVFCIWVRWSLPRLRYDQTMRLAWKILLPLSLLNVIGTGLIAGLWL